MSEDNTVPDEAAADTQDSPEPEEGASASEKPADSEDAAQAEGAEDETTEKDETDEGGKVAAHKDGQKESDFDKLLKKYGGNKDAMAKAYWEQANSNSHLHDRLASIEEYIKGQKEQPIDEAKAVDADPDVQALRDEINETETQQRAIHQEQKRLLAEYGKSEKSVAKLEGKLEASDPETAGSIKQDLAEARAESRRLEKEIRDTQKDLLQFDKELKGLSRQLKGAEQEARDKVSRQRQSEREERESQQAIRAEFVELVREEAKTYGVEPGSKTYNLLLV
jgi:chromosome segregation ATPase